MYWAERYILLLSTTIIVYASWAFGGRYYWAQWVIGILAWSSVAPLIMNVVHCRRQSKYWKGIKGKGRDPFRTLAWKRFLIFLPWILLSVIVVLSVFNPSFDLVREGTKLSFEWLDPSPYLPTTIDVTRTSRMAFLMSGLMLHGVALYYLVRRRKYIRVLLVLIFVNAGIHGIVGSVFAILKSDKVLGCFNAPNTRFFSTLCYHNHWVAFCVLCMGVGVGMIVYYWKNRDRSRRSSGPVNVFILFLCILGLSLPLSTSRTGMIMLGVLLAIALIATVLFLKKRSYGQSSLSRLNVAIIAVLVSVILSFVVWVSEPQLEFIHDVTAEQLPEMLDSNSNLRLAFTRDTVRMALDKPVWGWGLGSFRYAFRMYAGDEFRFLPGGRLVDTWFAHNDWAQFWAELGSIGFICLVCVPFGFLYKVKREGRRNIISSSIFVVCALVAGMALMEFPFSNPAVLATFIILFTMAGKYAILEAD